MDSYGKERTLRALFESDRLSLDHDNLAEYFVCFRQAWCGASERSYFPTEVIECILARGRGGGGRKPMKHISMLDHIVGGKQAWVGADMQNADWFFRLSAQCLLEIRATVAKLRRDSLPIERLTPG